MTKKLLFLSAFVVMTIVSHAQTKYTVTKSTYGTGSSNTLLDFKPLTKFFTAILYSDALVFNNSSNSYYKFARKIELSDGVRWNALDRDGNECQVTIKDYGTWTLIGIKYPKTGAWVLYQTL